MDNLGAMRQSTLPDVSIFPSLMDTCADRVEIDVFPEHTTESDRFLPACMTDDSTFKSSTQTILNIRVSTKHVGLVSSARADAIPNLS